MQSTTAGSADLGGVSLSVDEMLRALLAGISPVKVKLRRTVTVCVRTAFQRYIKQHSYTVSRKLYKIVFVRTSLNFHQL